MYDTAIAQNEISALMSYRPYGRYLDAVLKSLTQGCLYPSDVNHWFGMTNTSEAISISSSIYLQQLQRGLICLKKSLPLSSTRMNAGKSSTSIFQIASMPSSGYSTHSMLLMLF